MHIKEYKRARNNGLGLSARNCMFVRVDRLSFDTDGLTILPTFSYSPFVRIFLINYIFWLRDCNKHMQIVEKSILAAGLD